MKKFILPVIFVMLTLAAFWLGCFLTKKHYTPLLTSSTTQDNNSDRVEKELSLQKYGLNELAKTEVTPGKITLEEVTTVTDEYLSAIFSFSTSTGEKMTGLLNLPAGDEASISGTVLMLRGYVSPSGYTSGTGTKNAGIYFAKNGFLTFAPDFLGYDGSDDAPADSWQARFEKPLQVKQLLADLENNDFVCNPTALNNLATKNTAKLTEEESAFLDLCQNRHFAVHSDQLFIWAHSNGGQIALSTLEIIDEAIPTTLWAPVSVGFPYSVLFFTDENDDEGKAMRRSIALLEEDYDAFDFSHTQHLDKIKSGQVLQLHHGTADEAALIAWSDEFVTKINLENQSRAAADKIDLRYYQYAGADHNLRPDWDTVVARDLTFFREFLP